MIDAGCYGDDTPPVGEIPPDYRDVSPMLPSLYDGSEEPYYIDALLNGPSASAMAAGCTDGAIGIEGDATVGFAPLVAQGGSVCQCESVAGPTVIIP